jgi:hypothetical protein
VSTVPPLPEMWVPLLWLDGRLLTEIVNLDQRVFGRILCLVEHAPLRIVFRGLSTVLH